MFYDHELQLLQKMLTKCHVKSRILDPGVPLDEQTDRILLRLLGNENLKQTFFDFFPDLKPAVIYRLTDVFLCRYLFFALPFCEEPAVFMIGPYLNTDLSHQQALEQGERMNLPPRLVRELELFYGSQPVIREENHLFAMVNTFAEYVWNGEDNFENVDIARERFAALFPGNPEHNAPEDDDGFGVQVMEDRYRFENELIEAVAEGNAHKAELMMASFSTLSFENRTTDQLRNVKNYCIIMNTLMRKAAEKGGVHPVHIDHVSSNFARRIEELRSMSTLSDFMLEIMHTYCRLVKKYSMKNYSPPVQKAIIRIENDLTCDLSLRTVAQMNNVSPGYLSGLFKKETGQTFTGYVNSRRVHLAKRLLRTTNLQIQTIAQYCGILDFHYFCRIFKNSVGKTPTEYRSGYTFD